MADADTISSSRNIFRWNDSGLTWASLDKIDVGILGPVNVAATGPKPTISGRLRVGLPLTAHPSAVSDLNGIPDNVSYTYQWYRYAQTDDGEIHNELIDGATESTYTPTESEQGWKMKVQVGFTDSEGFQESMTSDPTDEIVKTKATEIWSAKLTPKPASAGGTVGYGASYPDSTLSDNTIDYGPKTYRVRDIYLSPDTGVLLLQLDQQPTEGESGTWILGVGGTEARLANSIAASQSGRFAWVRSSLSWTDGDMIDLYLLALPSKATGQPAITGGLRVGGTLTPDMSGVVDANGIPDDLSYQWVSSDGTTDTDIEGATESTYTLTESELGKTIKVRVGFTDHAGYEEGPLTSDATAAVGVRANEFWSAKLTAKLHSSFGTAGYGTSYPDSALSDDTITYGPRTYTVEIVSLVGGPNLFLQLDQDLTMVELDTWILDVGGKEFPLRAGHFTDDATTNNLGFFRPGLSWSDGDMIDLSLLALNSEATGQPDISSDGSSRFPRAGNTLTAGVSAVMDANGIPDNVTYTYQWVSSDGTTDTDIEGATASTYTLTGSEPGAFIKVRVGFTDHAGYEESLTSAGLGIQRLSDIWVATLTVGADPSRTFVGYGIGIRGDSLSYDFVTIGGHAYRITRIGVFNSSSKLVLDLVRSIGTEVLSAAEIANLVLDVDGTEFPLANAAFSGGTTLSWANSCLHWPQGEGLRVSLKVLNTAATGQPAITGRLRVGRTLTADMSGIVDANGIPDDLSYQWVASDGTTDTDIEGATASTYTLNESELGKSIKVRVGFTDSHGYPEGPLISDATAAVAVRANEFWSAKLTAKLSTSGATVGFGEIYPGSTLSDATITYGTNTYTVLTVYKSVSEGDYFIKFDQELAKGEIDTWILVVEGREFPLVEHQDPDVAPGRFFIVNTDRSWSDGDMIDLSMLALNTAATGQPTVGGTAKVGETLTAATSGIVDANGIPDDLSYQWLAVTGAGDDAIGGATGQSYTLTDAEKGKAIRVQVSFTDSNGYPEGPLTSDATGMVAALNYPATGLPAITGRLRVGETLTADTGGIIDRNGIPGDDAFSYQWLYSDGDAASDTAIEGATGPTYLLTASDDGKTLRVRVGFNDSDGFSESVTSTPRSLSTLITEGGFVPRALRHHTHPEVVDGVLIRIETFLTWLHPEHAPRFVYSGPDYGFERFQVQTRARHTRDRGSWGAWGGVNLPDPLPRWARTWNKLPVENTGSCEDRQWRIRAIYENPRRHSEWVSIGKYHSAPPSTPPAPWPSRDSSLTKTEDDSYRMVLRWSKSEARCWPNTGHEVAWREDLGSYFGRGTPPPGTELKTNGRTVVWDPATMTLEGNVVWTNWAASPGDESHVYEFEGLRNFQARVRVRNDNGWSPVSLPLLFSVNMPPLNDLVVWLDAGDAP